MVRNRKKSLIPSTGSSSMPSIKRFKEDVDLLFNSFFNEFFGTSWYPYLITTFEDIQPKVSFPKVNVRETDDSYIVDIAVAGFDKDDVKLELKDNCLSISADKKNEGEDGGEKYIRKEISSRSFNRVIRFPNKISNDKLNASYDNGIIKISMGKEEVKEKDSGIEIDVK